MHLGSSSNRQNTKMRKFLVQNSSDQPVKLAIEPWADLEILTPGSRVLFEYEDHEEPAEIEFSVMGRGRIVLGIVSDFIRVTGNNGEKIFRTSPEKGSQET
jgi:hypothetical protein